MYWANNIPHRAILLLIASMMMAPALWAQPEDVYNADALEEIRPSQITNQSQFVYRIQSDSVLRFYKINMSTALYGSKRAFLWPQELASTARSTTPLYGSMETLVNDSLVLADADAMFWKSDTGLIPLQRVTPPGLLLLRSTSDAEYQLVNHNGLGLTAKLPALFYTWGDTTTPCWIRSPGHIPKEYSPFTNTATYRVDLVELAPLPQYALLPHYMYPELQGALPDSATLAKVSQAMRDLEKDLAADSVQISSYLEEVRAQVPQVLDLLLGEDSTDYRARVHNREVEMMDLAKMTYAACHFSDRTLPIRARINELQTQLQEGRAELKKNGSPQSVWHAHRVFPKHFMLAGITLGQNIPAWASTPGPSGLQGIDLRWMMPFRIHGTLGWQLSTAFHGARWKFHANIPSYSTEARASIAGAGTAPLFTLPSKNLSLVGTLGAALDWKTVTARNANVDDHRFGFAGAGEASLQLYASRLPMLVSCQYRYSTDGFGALALQVGLPLPFGERTP